MNYDTICCISTAIGNGAISIIRISGKKAINICDSIFKSYNKSQISELQSHKLLIGEIYNHKKLIDEVLVSVFNAPKSYTGENVVEISCHGSIYIQEAIIQLLIENGCRLAKKGEFTLRAFLNGKLDLSQAEGIAELIASDNDKAHSLALKQMKGGVSNDIQLLRQKFIKFASLIELELDFSQEDVEFADRKDLLKLISIIKSKIHKLIDSFKYGNAIKNGIPISIIGRPNSGKSTLLNKILNEDRAIVSNIKGTTRDTIEEHIVLKGYKLIFIDTAGLRETDDKIEKIGISKTYEKIQQSAFVIYLIDKTEYNLENIKKEIAEIENKLNENTRLILVANKHDLNSQSINTKIYNDEKILNISAKEGVGIEQLLNSILDTVQVWENLSNATIVTNQRHFESLIKTIESIHDIEEGIQNQISGEFLALDIKMCLDFLGEITGEISNEDLLDSIFKDFCIGK